MLFHRRRGQLRSVGMNAASSCPHAGKTVDNRAVQGVLERLRSFDRPCSAWRSRVFHAAPRLSSSFSTVGGDKPTATRAPRAHARIGRTPDAGTSRVRSWRRSGVELADPVDVAVDPACRNLRVPSLVISYWSFTRPSEYCRKTSGVVSVLAPSAARMLRRCCCMSAVPAALGECRAPRRLAGPGVVTPRTRAPVDGVLDGGGHRAIVLGRDEQHALGFGDLLLELGHAGAGCSRCPG